MAAHMEDVAKQNSAGTASNYDLLRSKVQVANIKALLIQSQSNLDKSYLTLLNIIGWPLDQANSISLTDKLIYKEDVPSYDECEKLSFQNRPDLKAAQLKIDLEKEVLKMAAAENYPTASLSFSAGEEYPSRKSLGFDEWGNYWNILGLISIPIFEGNRVKSRIRQENSVLLQIELMLNDTREHIRYDLKQALLSVRDSIVFIKSQQENVDQAKEGFRLAEVGYKNGVNTQLELMDAQVALDTASKNYIQALYQYNLATANLDAVVGK
jgi:outer membrane protein